MNASILTSGKQRASMEGGNWSAVQVSRVLGMIGIPFVERSNVAA
jgi:hypothetical protein